MQPSFSVAIPIAQIVVLTIFSVISYLDLFYHKFEQNSLTEFSDNFDLY